MKYAMLPTPWEETLQALDAAGHERVSLDDAEVLIFNGGPDDFPATIPSNGVHPRPEPGPIVEIGQLLPGSQQNVLDDVLRGNRGRQVVVTEPQERSAP